jgi:hypothetical protein
MLHPLSLVNPDDTLSIRTGPCGALHVVEGEGPPEGSAAMRSSSRSSKSGAPARIGSSLLVMRSPHAPIHPLAFPCAVTSTARFARVTAT